VSGLNLSVNTRLKELNVVLPVATPLATSLPTVQTGNLCFVSGHIARQDGKPRAGQFGISMTTAKGQQAARSIAIDLLGTVHRELGDLERVQRIVKLFCLVNSGPAFTERHLVAKGASELLQEFFGASGKPARSAVGAAQLPMGAFVEMELVVEVR
jgi:enamine deaminase RidA (YjgF/YER057c/UK114 family)